MTIEARPCFLGRIPIPFAPVKEFACGQHFLAADGSGKQEWVVISENVVLEAEGHMLSHRSGTGTIERGRLSRVDINRRHLRLLPANGELDNSGHTISKLISYIAPETVLWKKTA